MRRVLVASLLGLSLTASAAFAADDNGAVVAPAVSAAATSLAQRPDIAAAATVSSRSFEPRRPSILLGLYAGSALLQGYDAYSTLTVLKHGGVEANPVMKGITSRPAVFIGLKAGMTMMSIMAAERMWKNNNRLGAVLTMAATNSLMAMVAANNARVLGKVRQ